MPMPPPMLKPVSVSVSMPPVSAPPREPTTKKAPAKQSTRRRPHPLWKPWKPRPSLAGGWPVVQARPVEPKPPLPRSLDANESTTRNAARTTGTMTSWAMRSNGSIVNAALPRFQQLTISGPW